MKFLVFTGNHPRHLYYANSIIENCDVAGVVMQTRENIMPKPADDLNEHDKNNFIKHFENRHSCEEKHFGLEAKIKHENVHYCEKQTLHDQDTIDFVKSVNPDIVFIFGVGMIRGELFDALPDMKINMHLGLSPRYRGSATLFWPFYFLEPNWAGSTFHIITSEPDAGDIVHQSIPKLEYGDTIHDVACKVVKQSAEDVVKIIEVLNSGKKLVLKRQIGTGKNFLSRDFVPQHLRMIYDVYQDNLVDHFLDKKIDPKPPKPYHVQGE